MRPSWLALVGVLAVSAIVSPGLGAETRSADQSWTFVLDPETREPEGSFEVNLAVGDTPAEEEALRRWLYGGQEPLAWAASEAEVWGQDYVEEVKELLATLEEGPPPESFNYYSFEGTEVVARLPDLLVVARFFEDYRGGAHGSHGQSFVLIDPFKGPVDQPLVRPDFWTDLAPWVEDDLRRQYDLPADEPLDSQGTFFDDHPDAPRELAPTPEGLVLVWNLYEIAPYVVGLVEVVVPWDVAVPVLTPWARHRLAPWLP